MPLFAYSPNIQRMPEMESNGLKRSHDEYSGDEVTIDDRGLDAGVKQQATESVVQPSKAMSPSVPITHDSSPLGSPASLTDADTSTPARNSPSPNPTPTKTASPLSQTVNASSTSNLPASTATSSTAQTPAKRKRRTAAEKEAEEKEKALEKEKKKKEREAQKEAKQAEKAKADAEKQAQKAKADAEKQAQKAKADAEKQAQKAEKAKAEAEKQAQKDEKRRKKEEEERKAQEEKEKKARAQPKLMAFFTKTPATPKKEPAAPVVKTESPAKVTAPESTKAPEVKKEEKSEYEKRFKPFFVHETVRMAKTPFEMDQETLAAKSKILEEYFDGKRKVTAQSRFDFVEVFQLPCRPAPRGRIHTPVRHTVEKMRKLTTEGTSEEDKKTITKETTDALSKIPMKTLRFWQDVRPPYKGTVTLKPYQAGNAGMRRLARKPTSRGLMPAVNYDHDSEAEWESEGEDVDIDDDDDEDLEGDGEDMDEFLDDSEDTGPARFVSANGLEPENSGLCWEDCKRMGPNRSMYKHRMEFILASLDHHSGIDPFSTKYWEPETKPKAAKVTKDQAVPTSAPSNAFEALGNKDAAPSLPKKLLESNHLEELKKIIQANPKIAKGGLVDLSYVALGHAKVSRNDIKEAIAVIAERSGGQGRAGSWVIKPLYLD